MSSPGRPALQRPTRPGSPALSTFLLGHAPHGSPAPSLFPPLFPAAPCRPRKLARGPFGQSLSGRIPSCPLIHQHHLFTQFGLVAESEVGGQKAELETQRAAESAHLEHSCSLSPRTPRLPPGPFLSPLTCPSLQGPVLFRTSRSLLGVLWPLTRSSWPIRLTV